MSGCTHNDRKIACETLADDDPVRSPESFLLSAKAELDWIDQNAFIERKESDEPLTNNPNPLPLPPTTPSAPYFGSHRQQTSSNVKSMSIIRPQTYADAKTRRPATIRLFPKREHSSSRRKSGASMAEPSSPKVSCIGRVRSKRDRSRRKKIGRQKQSQPPIAPSRTQKRAGFWSNFRCIFPSKPRKQQQPKCNEKPVIEFEQPVIEFEPPVMMADPPPLAAVKRFSSARRSDAWAADLVDRPISIGAVKQFSSGRRSDAFGSEFEPSDAPGIGAVKRFTSGRRSDAWAADLEASPPSLGAVKRFSSGRRSDAWAGDVDKSQALDPISIFPVREGGAQG